jgi:peptidoglycan/LPS O-acetylase OafA/YrhL
MNSSLKVQSQGIAMLGPQSSHIDFNQLQRALRSHIPGFDGLRGLAILAVIWHNSVGTDRWHPTSLVGRLLDVSANMGWLGVQLFFVLSGFLITGILLDEKHLSHPFRNFYVRRSLRIFPLYYATLTLLLLVFPALGLTAGTIFSDTSHQIWYWLYLANWTIPVISGPGMLSHFWSLSVEEQFYLFWPFAVILLNRRALLSLCAVLIVSAIVARCSLFQYGIEFARWRAYEFTFARWDALAIGAVLAIGLRDVYWFGVIRKIWLPVLGLSMLYMLTVVIITHGYAAVPDEAWLVINQSVAAVLFATILFGVVTASNQTRSGWLAIIKGYPLRIVGKYSYAMYVFHYPIVMWLSHELEKYLQVSQQSFNIVYAIGQAGAATILAFLLALVSWYVLERPCLRLKKHFYDRGESVKAAQAAAI